MRTCLDDPLIGTAVAIALLPIALPVFGLEYAYNRITGQDKVKEKAEKEDRLKREIAWKKEGEQIAASQKAEREIEYREYVRRIRLPEYLATMDWRGFEDLCCELFKRLGYEVRETPRSGDHGADALLWKDGEHTILQAKRFKNNVSEPIVRDLYGVMCDAGATTKGIVVTTGKVSGPARKWIGSKNIRIIELSEFADLVRDFFHENDIVPDGFVSEKPRTKYCPQCHCLLVKRKSRYGRFMGCSGWPKCKYTLNIRKGPL